MVATSSSKAASSHIPSVFFAEPVKDSRKLAKVPVSFGAASGERSDIDQSLYGVINDWNGFHNGRTARIPVFEKLMASFKMGRNLRHEKKASKLNLIYRD